VSTPDVRGSEHAFVLEAYTTHEEERSVSDDRVQPNPERDPQDWITGDEPMTGPQTSYLQTLCQEAGEEFDSNLTKAQASEKIEQLQAVTGRGT
jgi:hypothetical protein